MSSAMYKNHYPAAPFSNPIYTLNAVCVSPLQSPRFQFI